ncbi:hypothetical protein L0666_00120 [Octadecabacter sp. CECT 8868]|uniref:hypothetical protein n=1 Tax=Octadecabacter algicola TaxID=2909342 RepID=UPI001F2CFCB2|nr:hypothetical protein [Octadecabacter algicola]MCF2903378.1 hypothetical protein [Octadecabacter algicola]
MKKIVLHIGLPKTATTTIQNALCDHPDKLADLGIAYLQAGSRDFGDRGHHLQVQGLLGERGKRIRVKTSMEEIEAIWPQSFEEMNASSADQIMISSELFSFAVITPADIQKLKELLGDYEVRVVLVLRDIADFVDSVYAQRIKGGFGGTPGEFIADNWANLHWLQMYNRWANVFGEDNVRALDFGELKKGNLVDNFVRDAFDVSFDGPLFDTDKANEALPYYAAQMLKEINASDIPRPIATRFRIQIRDFFIEHGSSGDFRKAKFLDEDTKTMLRHYCKWPRVFNRSDND